MSKEAGTPTKSALVIDDEPQLRRLLRVTLENESFKVFEAATGEEGLREIPHRRPDVVILDLGLPDIDGVTVLKRLREWSRVPVIVVSVRDQENDKIVALDNGADDYVTKPFSSGELLARVRAAMRHAAPPTTGGIFRTGSLEVDVEKRVVKANGTEIKLTATEYALLQLFVKHAGKVLTQRQIMKEVWGPAYETQTHYLRVYMSHLREKLENDPSQPQLFITEPGIGYRMVHDHS